MNTMRYGIVIEKGADNCSAYVPDLPGCIATGSTLEQTKERIREAIQTHLDGMREDGTSAPVPTTICDWIDIA